MRRIIMWKIMILTHQYMSSLSVYIYFRWEVIIIQHPDSYFRHIEVSEKIGLQKSPHRLMGGTGGPWTIMLACYLAPGGGGRGIVMPMSVCLSVCVFVCLFVRVFAKFQSVISQPFLNRSLWILAYILRMGTPWLTNIFRILGQRSRS